MANRFEARMAVMVAAVTNCYSGDLPWRLFQDCAFRRLKLGDFEPRRAEIEIQQKLGRNSAATTRNCFTVAAEHFFSAMPAMFSTSVLERRKSLDPGQLVDHLEKTGRQVLGLLDKENRPPEVVKAKDPECLWQILGGRWNGRSESWL